MRRTQDQAFRHWHMAEIPLLFPAAGIMAGILVMGLLPEWPVWGRLGIPLIFVAAGIICRWVPMMLGAMAGVIGAMSMWMAAPEPVAVGTEGYFQGKVVRVDDYGELQRCVVQTGHKTRLLVSVYNFDYQIIKGDSVGFDGVLESGVRSTTVPYEKDGRLFALINSISGRCVADEGSVRFLSKAKGMDAFLYKARWRFKQLIRESGVAESTGDFLIAILLGENDIGENVREKFAGAGLSHLLALSGTHVAVIAFLVSFLFLPVEMGGYKRLRILLILAMLWGYALLTGMSPSVVRAVIMASFVLGGRLWGRRSNPVNSLCGAALIILIFSPTSLFMPGFQLSFLAVLGILMLMPLRHAVEVKQRWLRAGVDAILLPVAAVTATAPLAAWYFHSFPLWFLMANLPAAILLPAMIVTGGGILVCSAAGFSASLLVAVANGLYGALEWIASSVAGLPGFSGEILYFSPWFLLSIYCSMLMFWTAWRTARRAFLLNGVLVALFSIGMFVLTFHRIPPREIYVWRTYGSTNILCKTYGSVVVYTDAQDKYFSRLQGAASVTLADYLRSRSIRDSVRVLPLAVAPADVVSGFLPEEDMLVTYAFRGAILERAASVWPEALVLSSSIPTRRRKAYADTLSAHHYHFVYNLGENSVSRMQKE